MTENKQKKEAEKEIETMIPRSLFRLTEGIPHHELNQMIVEAKDCEAMLEKEIGQLEAALKDPSANQSSVDIMLASELTPADRFFTVSALLGRLRQPLAMPLPPNSSIEFHRKQQQLAFTASRISSQPKSSKKQQHHKGPGSSASPSNSTQHLLIRQQNILRLETYPEYRKRQTDSSVLLTYWKKISSHKTAAVFRRPVNPKEAPGYTDRILFPMDLTLIRKLITCSSIKSFAEMHQRIGMICHNCVSYNGREGDYGVVTRDFEAVVDDLIIQAVTSRRSRSTTPSNSTNRTTSTTPPEVQSSAPVSNTGTKTTK